jgi:hypothetical protein
VSGGADPQVAAPNRNHRARLGVRRNGVQVGQDQPSLLIGRQPVGRAQQDEPWLAAAANREPDSPHVSDLGAG